MTTVAASGFQFIDAVNRILRITGFIRGDTDVLTSFNDTNHNSTQNICQIAIQSELADLIGNSLIPYEHKTGTITLATNTRSYALPTDFIRLWGDPGFFYDSTQNNIIWEYPGGENQLRDEIYNYKTEYGYPNYFYFEQTTTKQASFFLVPDSTVNGRVLTLDYEADVNVSNSTDILPFQNGNEDYAFCDMAARRFIGMYEKKDMDLDKDPQYRNAKARFLNLIKPKNPSGFYGRQYV